MCVCKDEQVSAKRVKHLLQCVSLQHIYVASRLDLAITVFSRGTNGTLTWVAHYQDGGGVSPYLLDVYSLVCSQDNANVYAASSGNSAITVFKRDTVTGKLTYLQEVLDGVGSVQHMSTVSYLKNSNNGAHM